MDKTLKKQPSSCQDAVVVLANWFQFGPGDRGVQPCVESRMLLWCQKGKGSVVVNGKRIELPPEAWVFLPWKRHLIYEADQHDPFLVGAVHMIPRHAAGAPVVFRVAHFKGEPLAGVPERGDAAIPRLAGVVCGHFQERDRMALLAAYIVEKFQGEPPGEIPMRHLARLLIAELQAAVQRPRFHARPQPGSVRQLRDYIGAHLDRELPIETLARLAGCSVASVHRLFHAYMGLSPGRYVAQVRAQKGALLLRTTMLSIAEIGARVGLPDPGHFSRFFKRKMGLSPRAYQRNNRFF